MTVELFRPLGRSSVLSILVCTVPQRRELLKDLVDEISRQSVGRPVEVVIASDDGTMSVGAKRNLLRSEANGVYSCFVDDDDSLGPLYVEYAMSVVTSGRDCGRLRGTHVINGKVTRSIDLSMTHRQTRVSGKAWEGYTNHLCVIRTDLASKVSFPDTDTGEDTRWSNLLLRSGVLSTELDPGLEPTYTYRFNTRTTLTQSQQQLKAFKDSMPGWVPQEGLPGRKIEKT